MYTVHDDLVLDPFLGSGTTAQVTLQLGRRAVGYELNPDFRSLIEARLENVDGLTPDQVRFEMRESDEGALPSLNYTPAIADIRPKHPPHRPARDLYRVKAALGPTRLQLEDGREITLLGLTVPGALTAEALAYLDEYVVGKRITLRTPLDSLPDAAYVRLKNRIFINRKMLEMSLAIPDETTDHPQKRRFRKIYNATRNT
jgi:hypothetical protein